MVIFKIIYNLNFSEVTCVTHNVCIHNICTTHSYESRIYFFFKKQDLIVVSEMGMEDTVVHIF